MYLNFKIDGLTDYQKSDEEKLTNALISFRSAVNSTKFRNLIINHKPFKNDDNLNNQGIYNTIMSGQEQGTEVDFTANLRLAINLKDGIDKVGYTTSTGKIFTYRNMFNKLSSNELAGHYAHEYCHTLGFSDPDNLNDTSDNVPYEVGRIITQLAIAAHMPIQIIT